MRNVLATAVMPGAPLPSDAAAAESAATSASVSHVATALAAATARALKAAGLEALSETDDAFCREFCLRRNATAAYLATRDCSAMSRAVVRNLAWRLSNKAHILARIREYESAAAAAAVIDVQALIEHDRRIVEGFEHADQITQHLLTGCRYCHGAGHKYQWVDFNEFVQALRDVEESNEERRARKVREVPLPSDDGGYGYRSDAEPVETCPKCEGRGVAATFIADTTALEGPARAIVKGIKHTAAGIEVLLHDVDKAKERLYRAAGAFGDDAASVARGAAAGAAAGTAAAAKLAARVQDMSADEARKAYLSLVAG